MGSRVSCVLSSAAVLNIFKREEERPLVFQYRRNNKKGTIDIYTFDIYTLLANGDIYEIHGVDEITFLQIDALLDKKFPVIC